MKKLAPDREYIPVPPDNGCRCNECPFMKLNTLEKLYLCLRDEKPEIVLPGGDAQGGGEAAAADARALVTSFAVVSGSRFQVPGSKRRGLHLEHGTWNVEP